MTKKRQWPVLAALAVAVACMAPTVVTGDAGNVASPLGLLDRPPTSSDLNLHQDLFLKPHLSVGEASLLTSNPNQTWHAAQARLWMELPNSDTSRKLFLQSGLGFLERDPFLKMPSSLTAPSVVIPLGVGIDYGLGATHSLTTTFSLDVSEIRSGFDAGPHVSPGLSFGFRF